MNCLVTGGLGFLGAHLVTRLLKDGHSVEVLDNLSSPSDHPLPASVWANYYDKSIDRISESVYKTTDVIFHTAAIARTPPCIERPALCHEVNATGALRIFQAANSRRVVHCSSNVVLGVPTPYRASKLAAEHYLEAYNNLYDSNIIGLRFSNIVGPYLRRGDPAVLSSLRDCRAKNGYVEVTGDGTQTRNFLWVGDAVEAMVRAAFDSDYKGIIDVSSGIVTTMNEFVSYFVCPVKYIDDRRGDSKHLRQSPEDAARLLGWKATVGVEDMVRRSLSVWTD